MMYVLKHEVEDDPRPRAIVELSVRMYAEDAPPQGSDFRLPMFTSPQNTFEVVAVRQTDEEHGGKAVVEVDLRSRSIFPWVV